jgi:hypothetical protein
MTKETALKLFEDRKVRFAWDADAEKRMNRQSILMFFAVRISHNVLPF